ncbi:hypothetical protein ACIPCF_15075 [Paracoccus marcusii]|uniref:hypothetical protein n=1 Tax=Paracoccus marcusii TaxID=59779 RepID=UPI0038B7B951
MRKKIRDEMRGSHDAVIKWIVDVLEIGDIKPITGSIYYKDFMEACQRRHILAHNGGIVNEQYISKCGEYKIPPSQLASKGAKVDMTPEYLRRVTGRAFILGLFLIHMKVQKISENDRIASLESLLEVNHEFLVHEQTMMCVRVLDFAESRIDGVPANLRLCFAINRALAALHDPKITEDEQTKAAKEVLAKYDWSVTTPVFDLALACVRRDFTNLLPLARSAYSAGLGFISASTFIVFKEARKIEGFMDCFPKRPLQLS